MTVQISKNGLIRNLEEAVSFGQVKIPKDIGPGGRQFEEAAHGTLLAVRNAFVSATDGSVDTLPREQAKEILESAIQSNLSSFNSTVDALLGRLQSSRQRVNLDAMTRARGVVSEMVSNLLRHVEAAPSLETVSVVSVDPLVAIRSSLDEQRRGIAGLRQQITQSREAQAGRISDAATAHSEAERRVRELEQDVGELTEEFGRLHAQISDVSAPEETLARFSVVRGSLRNVRTDLLAAQGTVLAAAGLLESERAQLARPLGEDGLLQEQEARLAAFEKGLVESVVGILGPVESFSEVESGLAGLESELARITERLAQKESLLAHKDEAQKRLEAASGSLTEIETNLDASITEEGEINSRFTSLQDSPEAETTVMDLAIRKLALIRAITQQATSKELAVSEKTEAEHALRLAQEVCSALEGHEQESGRISAQCTELRVALATAFKRLGGVAELAVSEPVRQVLREEAQPLDRLRAALESKDFAAAILAAAELFSSRNLRTPIHPDDSRFQSALVQDLIVLGREEEAEAVFRSMKPEEYTCIFDHEEYIEILLYFLVRAGRIDEAEALIEPVEKVVGQNELLIRLAYLSFYHLRDIERTQTYCARVLETDPENRGVKTLMGNATDLQQEGKAVEVAEGRLQTARVTRLVVKTTFQTAIARYRKMEEVGLLSLMTDKDKELLSRDLAEALKAREVSFGHLEHALNAYRLFLQNANPKQLAQKAEILKRLTAALVEGYVDGRVEEVARRLEVLRSLETETAPRAELEKNIAEAFASRFRRLNKGEGLVGFRALRPELTSVVEHIGRTDSLACEVGQAVLVDTRGRIPNRQLFKDPFYARLLLERALERGDDAKTLPGVLEGIEDVLSPGDVQAFSAAIEALGRAQRRKDTPANA